MSHLTALPRNVREMGHRAADDPALVAGKRRCDTTGRLTRDGTAHPALAARLHAACGLRVVNRGKSKYYAEALVNFERARDCYLRAGMLSRWNALVDEVRSAHSRKTGFMPAFLQLAAGQKRAPEPSFLERARKKYGPGGG